MKMKYFAMIETEEHQEEFTGEFDGDPTGGIRPLFKEARGLARLEAHNRGLPAELVNVRSISYINEE
jgi:hypothetical protein